MKKLSILIILLLAALSLSAQQKSTRKALALSALVPGLGELYTKDYNKAAVFLTLEAATVFSYFRLQAERQWALNSYKQFAFSIAGISKDSEDWYYQILQDYRSSDIYNESIIRDARNYFLIYKNDPIAYEDYLNKYLVPEDLDWDWETQKNWYHFRSLRRDKQNMEIYMKFAFAAAIVNRFVSLVDAAISAKLFNDKSTRQGQLSVTPDYAGGGFSINYEFKF